MLLFLPIFLLLLFVLAITIWQAVRPGFGVPWLMAVGAGLVVWGSLLFLRFRLPLQVIGKQWLALGESSEFPYFLLDMISWPYAFALAALVLAVVLTASARLIHQTNPWAWVGSLGLTAIGMLAILLGNPLTLAVTWSAIDLLELVILLSTVQDNRYNRQVVVAFGARVLGILVLIWAVLLGRARGVVLSFGQMPPEISVYMLIAAGLRLGVLPLHLPYEKEVPLRRGLGTVLRLGRPASSLVLLARLPAVAVPEQWTSWLLAFTALAVFYCSLMWLFERDELSGRPYWMIALAGLAVACVIRGQPISSLAWGTAMILSGGLLFLYSARQRSTYFLPVLGLIGLTGLPFTPSGYGWNGVWTGALTLVNVLFILGHSALLAGYLRHAFLPGDSLKEMERWVQTVFPFGLLMLVITQWIGAYLNLRGSFALGTAWVGILSTLLALTAIALYDRVFSRTLEGRPTHWVAILSGRIGRSLAVILRLNWLYGLMALIFTGARRLVQFITTILEGDGGVLWVLVLLALLISVLRVGTTP